jgi:hypothetical protein
MKLYATLALIISVLVLCSSTLLSANFARFTMSEVAPFLMVYATLMTIYALITFLYIKRRERRRSYRRQRRSDSVLAN